MGWLAVCCIVRKGLAVRSIAGKPAAVPTTRAALFGKAIDGLRSEPAAFKLLTFVLMSGFAKPGPRDASAANVDDGADLKLDATLYLCLRVVGREIVGGRASAIGTSPPDQQFS